MIKSVFDTRWGFASLATILPLNWHSLFHDEFDAEAFLINYINYQCVAKNCICPPGRINSAPQKFAELVFYKFS